MVEDRTRGQRAVATVRRAAGLVAVVVVLVASVVGFFALRGQDRLAFVARETPEVCKSLSYVSLPFGTINSCRRVGHNLHYFGGIDVSLYVLLDTSAGLACLRVDYRNINAGRQYRSTAVEVSDAPDGQLTRTDQARLDHDIRRRSGVSTAQWTVNYGDG